MQRIGGAADVRNIDSIRLEVNDALRRRGEEFRYVLGDHQLQDSVLLSNVLAHGKHFALNIDPQATRVALSHEEKLAGRLRPASEVAFKGAAPVRVWLQEATVPVWLFPVAFANKAPQQVRSTPGFTLCSDPGCRSIATLKEVYKNPLGRSREKHAARADDKPAAQIASVRKQHQLCGHWMDSVIHASRFSWNERSAVVEAAA